MFKFLACFSFLEALYLAYALQLHTWHDMHTQVHYSALARRMQSPKINKSPEERCRARFPTVLYVRISIFSFILHHVNTAWIINLSSST